MSTRISKISLTVFVVLFVLSAFLLSVAGDYWPWYAVMSAFAVVPLVVGPGRYRLIGAIALVLSGVLIVSDIAAGRQFHAQHPEIRR
jgi:hypothetical protein